MLDVQVVSNWDFGSLTHTYSQRDTMLYALAVGMGQEPTHPGQLRYTFERDLQAVPSMAAIMCSPGGWYGDPRTGIDVSRVVHGEQDIRILKPLPTESTLIARARVSAIVDKGPNRGAILQIHRDLEDLDGTVHAQIRHVAFCRNEGGCTHGMGDVGAKTETLPAVPARAPDAVLIRQTPPEAALLYRLMGDYNPLHADPEYARQAGFEKPILHGLCIYGMATRAVLQSCCAYDARRLKRMAGRFSAPLFPGDTVETRIWENAAQGGAHVQLCVPARDAIVFNNGWFEFDPA